MPEPPATAPISRQRIHHSVGKQEVSLSGFEMLRNPNRRAISLDETGILLQVRTEVLL